MDGLRWSDSGESVDLQECAMGERVNARHVGVMPCRRLCRSQCQCHVCEGKTTGYGRETYTLEQAFLCR